MTTVEVARMSDVQNEEYRAPEIIPTDFEKRWEELVQAEPRLSSLYIKASRIKRKHGKPFCANRHWYTELKPELVNLVGYTARKSNPILKTEEAYSFAYHTIYHALPDCKHEGMCGG
jgi:hypothetical protein